MIAFFKMLAWIACWGLAYLEFTATQWDVSHAGHGIMSHWIVAVACFVAPVFFPKQSFVIIKTLWSIVTFRHSWLLLLLPLPLCAQTNTVEEFPARGFRMITSHSYTNDIIGPSGRVEQKVITHNTNEVSWLVGTNKAGKVCGPFTNSETISMSFEKLTLETRDAWIKVPVNYVSPPPPPLSPNK